MGTLNEGWPLIKKTLDYATVAKCAEMVGMAQVAFDMAVDYAKNRVQFGRPIGSFQAIKHKCSDMIIDVDGSRFITYRAAWCLAKGLDAAKDIAMAKAWTSDACRRVCAQAHQIHGGIGFTKNTTCSSTSGAPNKARCSTATPMCTARWWPRKSVCKPGP